MIPPKLAVDFNAIRKAFANEIQKVTSLIAILEEPEGPIDKRPELPYFSFKFTSPAVKQGDDNHTQVLDNLGHPTSVWNSGGQRKMTVSFNCYGTTHEEAYNYMAVWQTSLDMQNIQEDLRRAGIGIWVIGNIVDLSKLLNTGYEGRAQMDCTCGIAMNLQSDLGYMDTFPIDGAVTTDQGNVVDTSQTIVQP